MSKGSQDHEHLLDAVALLVLDVQERLLPAMSDPDPFVDRVAFAIESARSFNLRIIFTEQVPDKLGPTLPRLKNLAPNARVFRKSSFSALQARGLQDYLREQNIYHLLVCGLETPVCIYQTALQAADLELDTTLLSDCLASRRPEDDAFILPALKQSGCHILPSESVFYSMVADAENPRFRAYSNLVKYYEALRRGETPPDPVKDEAPRRDPRKDQQRPAPIERAEAGVDPSPKPGSSGEDVTMERPKPKRPRGRKRKPSVKAQPENETDQPAPTEAAKPAETAKVSSTEGSDSAAQPENADTTKPRRRRRGPRKPKPTADKGNQAGDKPSKGSQSGAEA